MPTKRKSSKKNTTNKNKNKNKIIININSNNKKKVTQSQNRNNRAPIPTNQPILISNPAPHPMYQQPHQPQYLQPQANPHVNALTTNEYGIGVNKLLDAIEGGATRINDTFDQYIQDTTNELREHEQVKAMVKSRKEEKEETKSISDVQSINSDQSINILDERGQPLGTYKKHGFITPKVFQHNESQNVSTKQPYLSSIPPPATKYLDESAHFNNLLHQPTGGKGYYDDFMTTAIHNARLNTRDVLDPQININFDDEKMESKHEEAPLELSREDKEQEEERKENEDGKRNLLIDRKEYDISRYKYFLSLKEQAIKAGLDIPKGFKNTKSNRKAMEEFLSSI